MIFVAALRAIRSRAAQQNARDIFNSAGRLLEAANKKIRKQDEVVKIATSMWK